jgi:antitoxin component of RelBE/YafQ-DinJ toxin-antitoxin module
MNTRTLTIRVPDALVFAAQDRAERLGVSLSLILRNELHRFAGGGDVLISDHQPNANLRQAIAQAEKEHAERKLKTFSTAQATLAHLKKLRR